MIRGHGVKFSQTSIVCIRQSYWLFLKKLCYFFISISVVIGHFSSNWPGSSSQTVSSGPAQQVFEWGGGGVKDERVSQIGGWGHAGKY